MKAIVNGKIILKDRIVDDRVLLYSNVIEGIVSKDYIPEGAEIIDANGGYIDPEGNITGWLNELAFAPVDYCKDAMVDEWSGDYGCGVKYFSQDGVIKLAPAAGIELDESLSPAEKLKVVQKLMETGDQRAADIYDTIGAYFGYAIAFYTEFYDIKHVLIMGRVTSGEGGSILLARAQEVLDTEFPELAKKIQLHIPDESSRRVGQSVAAASLPEIR